MKLFYILLLALSLSACKQDGPSVGVGAGMISRSGNPVEVYEMPNKDTCYIYSGYGISCVAHTSIPNSFN